MRKQPPPSRLTRALEKPVAIKIHSMASITPFDLERLQEASRRLIEYRERND